MAELTIPDLPDEIDRALHARAVQHGNSIEAAATAIITEAVLPADRITLGSLLSQAISPENRLTAEEHAALNNRDRTPAQPLNVEE